VPGLLAITREVSDAIAACELTHLAREPIDVARAKRQHAAYERTLEGMGCTVQRLPETTDMPDSVFIEDTAVVFDEIAIITRPGAASRRAETIAVAAALSPYRQLVHIEPPGTLDGGDVLVVGRNVFIGRTARTNAEGIAQARRMLAPLGYVVAQATVRGCLHLKSAVTAVADETVLIHRAWAVEEEFRAFRQIEVDPAEASAANVLRVQGRLMSAAAFPRTRDRLIAQGFDVTAVEADELAKAEGALTCCSLILLVA
jgi:dimethylargininase